MFIQIVYYYLYMCVVIFFEKYFLRIFMVAHVNLQIYNMKIFTISIFVIAAHVFTPDYSV